MAKIKISKKTLATIGVGVVAAIALACAVQTCSSERADKEAMMHQANALLQGNQETIDSLQSEVAMTRDLLNKEKASHMRDYEALGECGNDKAVLQDSIDILNQRLEECEKSKQKPAAKKKPAQKKKPVATKPAPCQPAKPSCSNGNGNGDIDVTGCRNRVNVNNGTVIDGGKDNAAGVCNQNSGNTNIKVNGNCNTVNVNNGTIINNNEAEKAYVECNINVTRTRTITYGRTR